MIDKPAPTGNVTTQETIILPTTEKSTADKPLAKPTPSTAPVPRDDGTRLQVQHR